MQTSTLRRRFYWELVLGIAGILLFVLTLVWKDWIELVLHIDPDAGNGALEHLICAVLLGAVAISGWLTRTEWRRARPSKYAAEVR
jgi:hypothetical protein